MSNLELKVDNQDINKLIKKLSAIAKENVIKKSLSESTWYLAGWSKNNRFRLGSFSKKNVHPTILTRRSAGGYRDRIFGQTPGEVRKAGNIYYARFGTNIRNKGFSYPTLHEFGGRFHPPRPVLTPAIKEQTNKTTVLKVLLEHIKEEINNQ